MDIKVFSKSQIKHYRPQNETVLISVQDVCDARKSTTISITTNVLMDASEYQSYIRFNRKLWSLYQGFFGFVGSLKASLARRFKY